MEAESGRRSGSVPPRVPRLASRAFGAAGRSSSRPAVQRRACVPSRRLLAAYIVKVGA
jgi:hypothetical protein